MELRGFRAENFARFHPGGSLGRRLLTQVKHVMKSENLPIVDEASPMLDVIHSISQGRLGLAVVLEGGLIHGIITDGDMRRVFENYGESAFRLTAGKIMTKEPKCISHDTKLQDVQDIMIGKKINSLLVTENGRPNQLLGVIQVYDIK
jgi:arabinose-5-phosphate isomerase